MTEREPKRNLDDALRDRLRRGDPAGGDDAPGPEEIAGWRRAMLQAIPDRPGRWPAVARLLPASAAIAVLILVVALIGIGRRGPKDPARTVESNPTAPIATAARTADGAPAVPPAAARTRTIHFRGPNGTRIIWTLNSEFTAPEIGESLSNKGETS